MHISRLCQEHRHNKHTSKTSHPTYFLSHRLSERETRWGTGEQDLLAFIIALQEWSAYLRGRHFIFQTDHKPIRFLQTKARVIGCQARWLDLVQSNSFEVVHVPGNKNVAPGALSRRSDHIPKLKSLSFGSRHFASRTSAG